MQNFRMVGKISDPLFSRLLIKIQEILRQCREPLLVSEALPDCLHLFLSEILAVKHAVKLRSLK